MECSKCAKNLKTEETLKCAGCRKSFHHTCVDVNETDFKKILPMNKPKWKCMPCKGFVNKSPLIEQPTGSVQTPSIMNIELKPLMDHFDEQFNSLNTALQSLRTDFFEELQKLTQTVNSWGTRIADLETRVDSLSTSVTSLNEERNSLRSEVSDLQKQLNDAEQRSRRCNLEIQNIPECRTENLIHMVETLGTVLGVPITADRIRDVHRVAHNSKSDRPKNIIVQLTSKRLRDDVISAARTRRGLTLGQFRKAAGTGTGGSYANAGANDSSADIYINEHLTLNNKLLFSKAREIATEKNYMYKWVKNGTLLFRKNDQSKVIAVQSEKDLTKL
ncbi:hypothetical protein O0L34_g1822 [Tuta absoluta]|nr:hypothetical protein O0L34_g1822 [Tuta absoluta]